MQTSSRGLELIENAEGLSLIAYQDSVVVWTIGYGHTLGVRAGQQITEARAVELLRKDVKRFESSVSRLVTVELNQNQFDALVSFTYNLGAGSLRTSTLLKHLNAGDYDRAAAEFDRWVYAGGQKLRGLIKRRAAERKLFETPIDHAMPPCWLSEVAFVSRATEGQYT